jgi:hypothetical protein
MGRESMQRVSNYTSVKKLEVSTFHFNQNYRIVNQKAALLDAFSGKEPFDLSLMSHKFMLDVALSKIRESFQQQ